MNTQLKIPMHPPTLLDPIHLATTLKSHFDREIDQNIDGLAQKRVIFSRNGGELQPINGWGLPTPSLKATTIKPESETVTIVGLDSSSIHVAETDEGSIYAGQAAAVFSQGGRLSSYIRIGPIIYYVDEIYASKMSFEISGSGRLSRLFLLDQSVAQQIIREQLEWTVALKLARMLVGSVILLDGCLKSSRFEERARGLRQVLEVADRNKNTVIGLSKTTNVGLLNRLSCALYDFDDLPAYLDIDELVTPFLSRVEGRVVLARFSEDGHPYRVDIPRSADVESSLSYLVSNDLFHHGYPETLRLAHHLSIFTPTQSDSVKSYLVKNAGVIELPSEDLRRVTLGRLGLRPHHRG